MYSISVITEMLFIHMRNNNNNIVATSKTNKADSYICILSLETSGNVGNSVW